MESNHFKSHHREPLYDAYILCNYIAHSLSFSWEFFYEIITSENDINMADARAITDPNLHLSCYFEYFIYAEMSTTQLKMAQKKHSPSISLGRMSPFYSWQYEMVSDTGCIYKGLQRIKHAITFPHFHKTPTQRYTYKCAWEVLIEFYIFSGRRRVANSIMQWLKWAYRKVAKCSRVRRIPGSLYRIHVSWYKKED